MRARRHSQARNFGGARDLGTHDFGGAASHRADSECPRGPVGPPAVGGSSLPKDDGKTRPLGIPTVADRIAQTVVKRFLEPLVEPRFHDDSYGYRSCKSALDAVGAARQRCWRAKTTQWTSAMRNYRTFPDGDVNASDRPVTDIPPERLNVANPT